MGDNKISEACPDKGPWEVCAGEPGAVISDDFTHDVMLRIHGDFGTDEALANYCTWLVGRLNQPHLQGEAVPVAIAAGISEFGVLECNLLPGGLELLQSTGGDAKLYLHPQPAELSEVSGNSRELGDGGLSALIEALDRAERKGYMPDAIRSAWEEFDPSALAATGKQQVGEAERERDLLAEAIHKAAIKSGIYRADLEGMTGPQLLMACDDMAECIKAQQVGEVQGDGLYLSDNERAVLQQIQDSLPTGAKAVLVLERLLRDSLAARQPVGHRRNPLLAYADSYKIMAGMGDGRVSASDVAFDIEKNMAPHAAPSAQGIDLGQFREAVRIAHCVVADAGADATLTTLECARLMELIDGRDAGAGVGR